MDTTNERSFEQAYQELEGVIAKLESGEMTLAESLDLYERGRQLSAYCQTLLESAELRIQRLHDDGSRDDYQPD